MPLRKRKLLVTTHSFPNYMPVPRYSERMVVVGPRYATVRKRNGHFKSINVPANQPYDLAGIVDALPAEQKPDLVISRVDASNANLPVNVSRIDAPKVLIIGDTHHMDRPLAKMVSFAQAEKYDFYLLDHTRQHAHWFYKAGIRNLHWIPGFLLPEAIVAPQGRVEHLLSFVGSVGPEHVLRTRLLEEIRNAGVDLQVTTAEPDETRAIYNRSLLTLNCSLNGDLNLRNFEVMLSGGFNLADRLTDYAGMDLLFEEGRHYAAYSTAGELLDQVRALGNDTDRVLRIKRAAHKHIMRHHSLPARSLRLHELVYGGRTDPVWRIRDPRLQHYGVDSRDDFMFKMTLYEYVQERHRLEPRPRLVFSSGSDHRIACDLLDLPRLQISHVAGQNARALYAQLPHGNEIRILKPGSEWQASRNAMLALTADEMRQMTDYQDQQLLITDWIRISQQEQQSCSRHMIESAGLRQLGPGVFGRGPGENAGR